MVNAIVQPILLSLKPVYANMVFERRKTVELRRRIASYMKNRDVFIYVTSPIMELRGGFRVGDVWSGMPKTVWHEVGERAGVRKRDFDVYFQGQNVANAFEITEVWEYDSSISLSDLRHEFSTFVVPQSWRYVRDHEMRFLQQWESRNKELILKRQEGS